MYNSKKGWYKLKNPEKFIPPHDGYMSSYNESYNSIEYKSMLELKGFQFCDNSEKISKFSIEPFAVNYLKPTDNKTHRYFPDLLIKFVSNHTFLVEIKSFNETKPPKKPKKMTVKAEKNYRKAIMTYKINMAKWKAAKKFCEERNIKFIILTEKELGVTY